MASGEASHWGISQYRPEWLAVPRRRVLRPARLVGDQLVGRPADAPAELDLLGLARCRVEAPGEHAAAVAHVALGRRRRDRQQFHLDVLDLAGRHLVLDHDADRAFVAAAHRDLVLTLVGLGRRDDPGGALDLAHGGARDLHLVVGAEAEPHGLVLRRERHLAATDIDAVTIERDGIYVGRGQMALTPKDETVRLGFGADDKVKVARATVRKIEGSTGIISSAKTDEREYKITVRSGHERPIRVMVEDQMPTSEIEDIKVELLPVTTPPTERDVRDRRGVLAWSFDAAPGEAKEIKLGWRIRWPADKLVSYEPRR